MEDTNQNQLETPIVQLFPSPHIFLYRFQPYNWVDKEKIQE